MSTAPPNFSAGPPHGWFPCRMEHGLVRWFFLGDRSFTEPFFEETVTARLKLEENRTRVQMKFEKFLRTAKDLPAPSPSALIFHVSRCGSTLLSQLLAADPRNVVLSEAPLLDQLLAMEKEAGDEISPGEYFNAGLRLLARQKSVQEKNLFVKLDSWHIFYYEKLRALFPEIPFVLLYRSPEAVFRSHQKQPGMHMVPGVVDPSLFGFSAGDLALDLKTFGGLVLEKYFRAYLDVMRKDANVIPANYSEGILTITDALLQRVNIFPDETSREKMLARAQFHSKYPQQVFSEEAKTQQPLPELAKAAALYEDVERARRKKDLPVNAG